MEKRPDRDLESRRRGHHGRWDSEDFFGLDVEKMSPRAQVSASLAVLIPVAIGLVALFTLVPNLWWLIFVFGWTIFPAFGLLVRGVAGLSERLAQRPVANVKERELLQALQSKGELTPAQAAMETSLSVNEADEMLEDLAAKGHLDVRCVGEGCSTGCGRPTPRPSGRGSRTGSHVSVATRSWYHSEPGRVLSAREIWSIG